MTRSIHPAPRRLHSLDALRGIAALVVVFYHWPHFFYSGTKAGGIKTSEFPLFDVFFLFYTKGWLAVDLFFSLSGFVFYWLYSREVAQRAISARDFAVLRFSRLYPLHFATLFAIAIGQIWFLRTTGSYFVYPMNDLRHFVLNLFYATSWGMERGYSFNGPNWSVSVEIAFYALFFVVCRFLPIRLALLIAIAIGGFLLTRIYPPIFRGAGMFFIGGCAFLLYQRIVAAGNPRRLVPWLLIVTAAAWGVTFGASWFESHGSPILEPASESLAHMNALLGHAASTVFLFWPAFLFPVTILTFALVETMNGNFTGRLSVLGDISYSSYMLHFPLQLATVGLMMLFGIDRAVFLSGWTLALFIFVLIAVSRASHRFLEVPAQRALRKEALAEHERGCGEVIR